MKRVGKRMATELNLLCRRLETERERLSEELNTGARLLDERLKQGLYGREGDLATEIAELEKQMTLGRSIQDQLAEVEHALHKLDLGTYGLCDICGQPIEPARLEALPQANLCLSCKARKPKNRM